MPGEVPFHARLVLVFSVIRVALAAKVDLLGATVGRRHLCHELVRAVAILL
jgi:hypothetical protein